MKILKLGNRDLVVFDVNDETKGCYSKNANGQFLFLSYFSSRAYNLQIIVPTPIIKFK